MSEAFNPCCGSPSIEGHASSCHHWPSTEPVTREEWESFGNPPGSFDEVVAMAAANARRIYRAARVPHQWDEWETTDARLAPQERRDKEGTE